MRKPLLDLAQEVLGWPGREDLFRPSGAAKSVLAKAADQKIGTQIRRLTQDREARIGILIANPAIDITESPLTLVCEFPKPVSDPVLGELQRLCWNFSLSPQVITVEPHLIRSFTCCEQIPHEPDRLPDPSRYLVQDLPRERLSLSDEAARALHWVSLISGEFYQANEKRFRRDQRADHQLLANLKFVRDELLFGPLQLNEDVCHDLLARVIFIQFLMDRKDQTGKSALDSSKLEELSGYRSLGHILRDKERAYELFKYLNQRFNGDLFAGNGDSDENRSLLKEKVRVDQAHLDCLAQLVEGKLVMETGQICLWKQYAFDVIPLEFISSIYEEFVSKRGKKEGAYYTPQHLVDFVLDGVLPWNGDTWDLKVMDPACGSGVFLVKAYQRLVHRWRLAHDWLGPPPAILRSLLEENILGVNSNAQAARVASFSLYLAMCDHIDPVDLWEQTTFPKLMGERIVCSDFFAEDVPGFRTQEDANTYDLVVGNPPWGDNTVSDFAVTWAADQDWSVPHSNVGPLFLPKCAKLTQSKGRVSMLQPAKVLLFNRGGPTLRFRKELFETYAVAEIVNLAAVRFENFRESDSPSCIVTLRPVSPKAEPIAYLCPKPARTAHDENLILIDPQDINSVTPREALESGEIWATLMWGGRRDMNLLKKLQLLPRLLDAKRDGRIISRKGLSKPGKNPVEHPGLKGRKYLIEKEFPPETFLQLSTESLPEIAEPFAHRKTNLAAFNTPQLILKLSWQTEHMRFRACLVSERAGSEGVIVSDIYVSVSGVRVTRDFLQAACLAYNSKLAVYYLVLIPFHKSTSNLQIGKVCH